MAYSSKSPKEIVRGDSIGLKYGVTTDSGVARDMQAEGWTCRVIAKIDLADETPAIDETLTEYVANGVGMDFVGIIEGADSLAMTPGTWWILAQLDRASTGESKEYQDLVRVVEHGV